jgi:hypothetical protein
VEDDGLSGAILGLGWGFGPYSSPPGNADDEFFDTAFSAACVSKSWLAIVRKATDRAVIRLGDDKYDRSSFTGVLGPQDPLALLRARKGGVLRALSLVGAPEARWRLCALACALGKSQQGDWRLGGGRSTGR